ncbi:MAG: hypothetical protein HC851_10365 [Acaryochloris sp. RU_4_1]|nr:hypothetical protein [Acaryochloris sp. SU_5_25]NJM66029.1 hypothetical protein [Acaryochloris sp. RU_4_1]NJN37619.1 hypothetical protein [Acaryochloridaceae cyanobacterium CSU_3_4]NJR53766.1 hypothetical protein [Acaryochloris sp. CRU_2_0]
MRVSYVHHPLGQDLKVDPVQLPSPELMLASAREVYQAYCQIHRDIAPPIGVAMDRHKGRGQLIFAEQPILLPHEYFIPAVEIQGLEQPQPA